MVFNYRKFFLLLAAALFILIGSSCGGDETDVYLEDRDINDSIETLMEYETQMEYRNLSIYVLSHSSPNNSLVPLINRAMRNAEEHMLERGVNLSITRTVIDTEAIEEHYTRLQTQFMAGNPPDLLMVLGHPLFQYARAGFLANMYDLIYNDPYVTLDDFFCNVLEAFEHDGRLIAMPMLFSPQFIGINAMLPEGILERFNAHSTITVYEMLGIQNELVSLHPEYSFLAVGSNISSVNLVRHELSNHVNLVERTINMDINGFASFLDHAHLVFGHFPGFVFMNILAHGDVMPDMFTFSNKYFALTMATALLEVDTPEFINHIPLVDDSGRIMLSSTSWTSWDSFHSSLFTITSGTNADMAWEMLKKFMYEFANFRSSWSLGMGSLETPIKRSMFADRAEYILTELIRPGADLPRAANIRFPATGNEEARRVAVENAVSRLAEINEMPMVIPLMIPASLFEDVLREQFFHGLISSHEAAHQINNRISLFLIE